MKNSMPLRFAAGVALTLALLGARPACASSYSLALDFTGNRTAFFSGSPGVVGWSFQVTRPLLLYGIGFFDPASQPTLGTAVLVGLWDSGGNLLASGGILNTTNHVVVPSIDCCGEWLFDTNGNPFETLSPGTYVIVALIPANSQTVIAGALTAPTFPGITFLENLEAGGLSGLVEPNFSSPTFGLGFSGPTCWLALARMWPRSRRPSGSYGWSPGLGLRGAQAAKAPVRYSAGSRGASAPPCASLS